MTNIYHIVHFDYDDSIYVYFDGCNFKCKGCIMKITRWDPHLPSDVRNKLALIDEEKTLSLHDLQDILESFHARRAVLTGGEPTVDRDFTNVVKLLSDLNMETMLFTNGHLLNTELIKRLEDVGLDIVYVSIKAYSDFIHKHYTGHSNKRSLENFKLLKGSKIELRAGTILIPDLIDVDEIERLSKFVASIDPNIELRIAAYVPVPNTQWRSPTKEEMTRAAEIAGKHLKNVYYTHSGMDLVGEFHVVYPKL